jgi:hypothetical protein
MSAKATAPKVDIDHTREQLERAGLGRAAEQLDELVSDAVKSLWLPRIQNGAIPGALVM